jgi:hypothetical protein
MKTIHQLSQSVWALTAFLAALYLFLLTVAATDAPAGQRVNAKTLKDDAAHLAEIGEATDEALISCRMNTALSFYSIVERPRPIEKILPNASVCE